LYGLFHESRQMTIGIYRSFYDFVAAWKYNGAKKKGEIIMPDTAEGWGWRIFSTFIPQ
jgi:hypothetical protein